MLLSKVIDYYIATLRSERKSEKTIFVYSHNLSMLLGQLGNCRLNSITTQTCREYQAWRAENNLSGRKQEVSDYTLHQSYRVLNTFFRWCKTEGLLKEDPMINVKPPELGKTVFDTYTQEEIHLMMDVCDSKDFRGARNRAMIAVLLDTGIRESELAGLTLKRIDFQSGVVKVIGKKKKERIVHISDKCLQVVRKYLLLRDFYLKKEMDTLFVSEERKPMTPNGVLVTITKIGKKVGVHAYVHKFRHTCAIEYLRSGGNLATLKEMLGHEHIETTMKYLTALNSDDVINAHRQFSPGDRFL